MSEPLGYYTRGYLPHWDQPGLLQMITFRLADSLPLHVLSRMQLEVAKLPEGERRSRLRNLVEEYLDAGHGSCCLRNAEIAKLLQEALIYNHGKRYLLLA